MRVLLVIFLVFSKNLLAVEVPSKSELDLGCEFLINQIRQKILN